MEAKRFTAKVLEKIDNGKGYWNYLKMGVFDGETQIGEYVRNYSAYGESTFYAFEQAGKWYALYSPDYTVTRLMSLPDCKDIGGEVDPKGHGFCPTGFYVPELCGMINTPDDPEPRVTNHDSDTWALKVPKDGHIRYYWPDAKDHPQPDEEKKALYLADKERTHKLHSEWSQRHPFVTQFAQFGFVCGCHWGDDSSWKVQFIDLSKVSEGIITRDDRFGYIELAPASSDLGKLIHVQDRTCFLNDSFSEMRVNIATNRTFDMNGKEYRYTDEPFHELRSSLKELMAYITGKHLGMDPKENEMLMRASEILEKTKE